MDRKVPAVERIDHIGLDEMVQQTRNAEDGHQAGDQPANEHHQCHDHYFDEERVGAQLQVAGAR